MLSQSMHLNNRRRGSLRLCRRWRNVGWHKSKPWQVLANQSDVLQILFLGHADARGAASYNMSLSEQRAIAVRDQVIALQPGLAGRISAEGRGELQPIDMSDTERAYDNNRRLEIIILQ